MTDDASRYVITRGAAAFALFVVDAFVIGQGGLVVLASVVVCPVMLVATLIAAVKRRPTDAAARASVVAMWIFAVCATVFTAGFHERTGQRRAETVIAACKRFHAATGAYPQTLEMLVPTYLPSIPRAKYTVAFSRFEYMQNGDDPRLTFTVVAPFMRSTYRFSDGVWITID